MAGMNFKPASLKQRICSLDLQIKTKKALVQNLIDQKHELRQSYLVSMEKFRQNIVKESPGIDSIQDDYSLDIENLDKEEQVLALELDELSNQRYQLRKTLLESNASLFIAKNHILFFLGFVFLLQVRECLSLINMSCTRMFHNNKTFRISFLPLFIMVVRKIPC